MRVSLVAVAGALAAVVLVVPALAAQQPEPVDLEGLVVTAAPIPLERSALGASVTVLEGDELRLRGVTRVVDALQGVPGVIVARNGSFGAVPGTDSEGAAKFQEMAAAAGFDGTSAFSPESYDAAALIMLAYIVVVCGVAVVLDQLDISLKVW